LDSLAALISEIFCGKVLTEKEQKMTRRKRRNHSPTFKAKVALAAHEITKPGTRI
jgi:hypothetical protein